MLAIMAGLLCALAGVKHASNLKGEAARLERWVQLLTHLELLLQEGMLSIPEALCAAADGSALPDRLLRDMAGRLAACQVCSLADAFSACQPGLPEQDVLARLFSRMGHGTKESRCLALQQSAGELRHLAQSAAARSEKDAKLWQSLAFIGGACLTILLL